MPCTNSVARLLLKDGKAKCIRRTPFTLKLTMDSTTYTQDVTLGVDTGFTIGSAAYSNGRILYTSQVQTRSDVKSKMYTRSMYRRNRRYKLRYREPRFLNRHHIDLTPTLVSRLTSHCKEINFVRSILPVSKLILETATFDVHRLINPDVTACEYQHGPQYSFANTREYVLYRDKHTCQMCNGRSKDPKLEVHHIQYRSNGGTNNPSNLITLCHSCHEKLHRNNLIIKASTSNFIAPTQCNVISHRIMQIYPDCVQTYGYITKYNRQLLGVQKDHHLDACTIASEGNRYTNESTLIIKRCVPKRDVCVTQKHKGTTVVITKKIHGFKKFDKVRYFGEDYFVSWRNTNGYFSLSDINGNIIDFSSLPRGFKTPKYSRLKRLSSRSSWILSENS